MALEGSARVFGDSSFFYAALDRQDRDHARAQAISLDILNRDINITTTWEVVVEVAALLRYRVGFRAAEIFLTDVLNSLAVISTEEHERAAALAFFRARSRSRRLSLCDAISYVVVSTRLNWAPCLSFDRDFAALGLTVVR